LKELAEKESAEVKPIKEIIEIGDLKVVKRNFGDVNIERIIRTASQIVRKEPNAITLFYASNEKTARIVVMAGKEAIEKGVNAEEIAKAAASVLGGGGGGRADFAQGGGTKTEKLKEALNKAEEKLRMQLSKKT
jgi:alanyl-tRNA synthetase